MSQLLARLARTLSSHWKRSLAAAVGVLVLLVAGRRRRRQGRRRLLASRAPSRSRRSTSSRRTRPAFAGADSTLVFTVDEGKISDPAPKAAIEGALAKVRELDGVALVGEPVRAGRPGLRGRAPGVGRRALLHRPRGRSTKADGEALIAAGRDRRARGVQVEARGVLIDLASEQDAPVGELIGVLIAIVLLTLLFRSGRRWPRR